MTDSGPDEEVIARLEQHHAQVLGWSRRHVAAENQDLRLRLARARVRSRSGPKLAGSVTAVAILIVAVALAARLLAPNQTAGPGATLSGPPTGPSSPYATAAGSRLLSISGGGDVGCQSEGGCAAFARIQGVDESPQPELRFEMSETGPTALPDAPRSIVPGRYTVSAHLNWVSDVIMNGQSPQVGGVVGSCNRDFVVEPSVASVAVRITFHGLNPCEIAVETSIDSPSPTVAVSPTSGPIRSPGATMIASGFTTAGVATGWNSFSWTSAGKPLSGIGQVLQWSGGYVAAASLMHYVADPSPGLWISADGQTWTAARGISDDAVRISVAPAGLVAIGFDGNVADGWTLGSAWSSSDGRNWTKLGKPDFPGSLVSIAGTSSGMVATVANAHGTGKGQYGSFQIEFSTDGLHWTAENVSPGLASAQVGYGEPPHVQTHAGQFFLMGSAGPGTTSTGMRLLSSVSPPDEMWLSADGKTWTKSAGGYSASGGLDADYIDFGRDGMILHTDAYGSAPGATGIAYSNDGGQTWHEDTNYGPLGPTTCQGQCVNGEDGVIGANGTYFVAVKHGGKQAWLSYDGQHWSSIAWTGGDPTGAWNGDGFVVMPRGVLLAGGYGAAS